MTNKDLILYCESHLINLLDHVQQALNDKGKITLVVSSRIKAYIAEAYTEEYINKGRRKIVISLSFLKNGPTFIRLIKLLVHEYTHFKESETRKLRKLVLRNKGVFSYEDSKEWNRLVGKHPHNKSFRRLVQKLEKKVFSYLRENNLLVSSEQPLLNINYLRVNEE